jgi:hypothetical protein
MIFVIIYRYVLRFAEINVFLFFFILFITFAHPPYKGPLFPYTTEIHIYIEEVERKRLGRGVGLQLPAVSFS